MHCKSKNIYLNIIYQRSSDSFRKHGSGGIKYLKFTLRSRVAIFTGKKKTALLQITGLVVKFEITIRGKHRDDIIITLHDEFHCTAIRTFSTFWTSISVFTPKTFTSVNVTVAVITLSRTRLATRRTKIVQWTPYNITHAYVRQEN